MGRGLGVRWRGWERCAGGGCVGIFMWVVDRCVENERREDGVKKGRKRGERSEGSVGRLRSLVWGTWGVWVRGGGQDWVGCG